jgi:hypothetical protein
VVRVFIFRYLGFGEDKRFAPVSPGMDLFRMVGIASGEVPVAFSHRRLSVKYVSDIFIW